MEKSFDYNLISRVLKFLKPYKKFFFFALTTTILLAAFGPVRPYLVQYGIDNYIFNNDYSGLLRVSILIFILLLIQTGIQYAHTMLTNFLGQSIIRDLRTKLFAHMTKLRLSYFDKTPIGQLVTRNVSDIETINEIFSEGIITILGDILQVLVIIGYMFYQDWKLTLISLTSIPFLLVATYIFKEKTKKAFQEVRNEVGKLNTFLQEHISGMAVVQIFSREKEEFRKFKDINARHRDAHVRSVWYYSIFFPVVELMSAASLGILIWYGSKSVLNESITPGVIVSFILLLNMLFRPIRELADKFNTLQMGMVGAERVFKILDIQELENNFGDENAPTKLSKGNHRIEFKNVFFSYDGKTPVLKNINLIIEPGETIALVGATGAGKSSTINILNRFYDIQSGEILIDNIDIKDIPLKELRSKIGTVLQDVFLFSESIEENIRLGKAEITREQIEAAAKDVGALEFINRLPGSFDFNISERGNSLSVGQGQLISFIRALVYNPEILILDEATSSVDSETEDLIQRAIYKLMEGRTSIVIAHRLSTVQHADKIVVLDKGEIMEMGTHSELLQENGFYKRLYDFQLKKDPQSL